MGMAYIVGLIGLLLSLVGGVYFNQTLTANRNLALDVREEAVAVAYATELLEFLRSFTPTRMKEFLAQNPFDTDSNPSTPPLPYYFCSHNNLLDRVNSTTTTSVMLNADPMADLPVSTFNPGPGKLSANRYFQVQVVDLSQPTLNPRTDICDKSANQIYLYGVAPSAGETIGLGQYERFLITVGVTWTSQSKKTETVRRVAISSLLPEAN